MLSAFFRCNLGLKTNNLPFRSHRFGVFNLLLHKSIEVLRNITILCQSPNYRDYLL